MDIAFVKTVPFQSVIFINANDYINLHKLQKQTLLFASLILEMLK